MSRLFFNEDPNHFLYTRSIAGVEVGEKEIRDFIYQYKDTAVTDFMVCLNSSIGWFPCKSRLSALTRYERETAAGAGRFANDKAGYGAAKLLWEIYRKKGIPLHKVWFSCLREIGINPWISLRANDVHNNEDENNFLHSDFFVKNPGVRRGSHRGASYYFDNALDFCRPEVREHLLSLVREALEEFDAYGLEIDWMREIYSVHIGREEEGARVIGDLMEQIKGETDRAARRRGHPVKLGIRLPSDPLLALRLGFDAVDLADRGLVDLITVTGRWATTDNDMPVDFWKKILKGKPVLLAAGLEYLLDPMYTEPHKVFLANSPETAAGSAAAYLSMGADAVYLFNYMDSLAEEEKRPELFRSGNYFAFLRSLGDPEELARRPRRHVVTYCDVQAPGVPNRNPLPLECGLVSSGNRAFIGKREYKTLRIPTGRIPPGSEPELVLGTDSDRMAEGEDFEVYVNAVRADYLGRAELPQPAYPGLSYYRFRINRGGEFPNASLAEIGSASAPIVIKWAEIDVGAKYPCRD